jgi:hypothetical protein
VTERARLPNRRAAEGFVLRHGGAEFCVSVGRYDDGRPAELFVDGMKSGTDLRESLRDAALLASLALQYGCPLAVIAGAVQRDGEGRPLSVVGAVVDVMGEAKTHEDRPMKAGP